MSEHELEPEPTEESETPPETGDNSWMYEEDDTESEPDYPHWTDKY